MKLNNFAYSYSKPLRNHTLKIMKIIPGNLLKNLEKSWKYHGILSARKSGNPGNCNNILFRQEKELEKEQKKRMKYEQKKKEKLSSKFSSLHSSSSVIIMNRKWCSNLVYFTCFQ